MFHFVNVNPENERIQDCVIRAISLALNIPYYNVVEMLSNNGDFYECDEICISCYSRLLNNLCLMHYKSRNKTVREISEDFYGNILLIRINGHLTCSLFGRIMDIWDCSEEIATDFWVVN